MTYAEELQRIEEQMKHLFCCDECGKVSKSGAGWVHIPAHNWMLCNERHVTRTFSYLTFDKSGRLASVETGVNL